MGAEGRYEDWLYLRMLEREWLGPQTVLYDVLPEDRRPSARAIMVLMFWSYFETRIERLFRETAKAVPDKVMDHLLERHASVGARMDKLYKVVFSTTYPADLNSLGYGQVAALLQTVQKCRNRFAHGHPEAIDDALVEELVAGLKDEHDGWVARLQQASEGRAQGPGKSTNYARRVEFYSSITTDIHCVISGFVTAITRSSRLILGSGTLTAATRM